MTPNRKRQLNALAERLDGLHSDADEAEAAAALRECLDEIDIMRLVAKERREAEEEKERDEEGEYIERMQMIGSVGAR